MSYNKMLDGDRYSFCDGYLEAVVFVFYDQKTKKLLVEKRPNGDIFFPSGKIEKKDHDYKEDYKTVALKREVKEEFAGKVSFDYYQYLGSTCWWLVSFI